MLKELFEASFYKTFPKKGDKVLMLEERMAQGGIYGSWLRVNG